MRRYIDLDRLIFCLEDEWAWHSKKSERGLRTAMQIVKEQPIADAVEVRHGAWEKWENHPTIYGKDTLFVCSECTAKYTETSRYCPYCGAKMDGERGEENEGCV